MAKLTFKGRKTGRKYVFQRGSEPIKVDWLDADCFLEYASKSGRQTFEKVRQSANRRI